MTFSLLLGAYMCLYLFVIVYFYVPYGPYTYLLLPRQANMEPGQRLMSSQETRQQI